jgi:hypothetical protein
MAGAAWSILCGAGRFAIRVGQHPPLLNRRPPRPILKLALALPLQWSAADGTAPDGPGHGLAEATAHMASSVRRSSSLGNLAIARLLIWNLPPGMPWLDHSALGSAEDDELHSNPARKCWPDWSATPPGNDPSPCGFACPTGASEWLWM